MARETTVSARRLDDGEVEVLGVTHCGATPAHDGRQFVGYASPDHRWVVVRTAGIWFLGKNGMEYRTFPGSVRFHRLHRCEAAAHADAESLPGGAVVEVD